MTYTLLAAVMVGTSINGDSELCGLSSTESDLPLWWSENVIV